MQAFAKQNNETAQENQSRIGYYDVHIRVESEMFTYRVYARSDYAAAVQVRRLTGWMPKSEHDVERLFDAAQCAAPRAGKPFDLIAA